MVKKGEKGKKTIFIAPTISDATREAKWNKGEQVYSSNDPTVVEFIHQLLNRNLYEPNIAKETLIKIYIMATMRALI